MDSILSVRQVTEKVKQAVEARFPYVWVRGEVTNLSRPSSGHVYFSLKEGDALLNCVWFRNQQKDEAFDPLTGEVWEDGPRPSAASTMENGQTLICAGHLTVYGARGQYQMVVDFAQAGGLGLWHQEFEALKRRLAAEGLFDQERKRPIPFEPERVAVVTAPSGAAIRDFIRIAGERGLGAEIRIYPTPVQGDEAPPRIVEALRQAGEDGWAQVIVLIRGGGSMQDLWAFNDERVARAVYASPVPILTGIGHEIDRSIADFTADLSAATPSHTAQILWQERHIFEQHVDGLELALRQAFERSLEKISARLEQKERALRLLSPLEKLRLQEEKLAGALRSMDAALSSRLAQSARALEYFSLRLKNAGDQCLRVAEQTAERTAAPLHSLGRMIGLAQEHELARMELSLKALDPYEPLKRGYAMALTEDGSFLRSVAQTEPGRKISVELADGRLAAIVEAVESRTDGADA
ncbi:MAG: exodeoxyribonuclease VII large subunit [Mailhella sp.]|nr:exodeoxyribonuclease VII large subunit [Mailhella sp.]